MGRTDKGMYPPDEYTAAVQTASSALTHAAQ